MVGKANRTLLELLIEHQLRMDNASDGREFPLTLLETHLLNNCQRLPSATPGALFQELDCSKALITRCLGVLEERGIISMSPEKSDGRSKLVKLTAAGDRVLKKQNQIRIEMVEQVIAPLNTRERAELGRLFNALSDGLTDTLKLETPVTSAISPDAHPVLPALERLTRIFGLLFGDVLRTGLRPDQFQILARIRRGVLTGSALSTQLSFHISKVSRDVGELLAAGLVTEQSSATDRRIKVIQITKKGASVVDKALQALSRNLTAALSVRETNRLAQLIVQYVGDGRSHSIGQNGSRIVKIAASEDSRQQLREAYLKYLLEEDRLSDAPAIIFPEGARCFAVYDDQSQLVGGAMFSGNENRPEIVFATKDNPDLIIQLVQSKRDCNYSD